MKHSLWGFFIIHSINFFINSLYTTPQTALVSPSLLPWFIYSKLSYILLWLEEETLVTMLSLNMGFPIHPNFRKYYTEGKNTFSGGRNIGIPNSISVRQTQAGVCASWRSQQMAPATWSPASNSVESRGRFRILVTP